MISRVQAVFLDFKFETFLKGAGNMLSGWRHLLLRLMAWVWSPDPTWWKERMTLQIVLWLPHVHHGTCLYSHTLHIHTCNTMIRNRIKGKTWNCAHKAGMYLHLFPALGLHVTVCSPISMNGNSEDGNYVYLVYLFLSSSTVYFHSRHSEWILWYFGGPEPCWPPSLSRDLMHYHCADYPGFPSPPNPSQPLSQLLCLVVHSGVRMPEPLALLPDLDFLIWCDFWQWICPACLTFLRRKMKIVPVATCFKAFEVMPAQVFAVVMKSSAWSVSMCIIV